MITNSPTEDVRKNRKLKRAKRWQPCPVEAGDEHFANGIFHFNISRALACLDANPDRFPIEVIAVATIPDYGGKTLDETTVQNADLTRPILFAEISPGRYNVIDGHHRVAKARRGGVATLPSRKIPCPDHLAFLISAEGYASYVDYWNSKLDDLLPARRAKQTDVSDNEVYGWLEKRNKTRRDAMQRLVSASRWGHVSRGMAREYLANVDFRA